MHPGAGAVQKRMEPGARDGWENRVQAARERVDNLIDELRDDGLLEDEIRRLFEAGLLRAGKPGAPAGKR